VIWSAGRRRAEPVFGRAAYPRRARLRHEDSEGALDRHTAGDHRCPVEVSRAPRRAGRHLHGCAAILSVANVRAFSPLGVDWSSDHHAIARSEFGPSGFSNPVKMTLVETIVRADDEQLLDTTTTYGSADTPRRPLWTETEILDRLLCSIDGLRGDDLQRFRHRLPWCEDRSVRLHAEEPAMLD
jgi:hypothetical protein